MAWNQETTQTPVSMSDTLNTPWFPLLSASHRANRLEAIGPKKLQYLQMQELFTQEISLLVHGNECISSFLMILPSY